MAKLLNNRYIIDKKIGSGGMGEVYKGFDTANHNAAVAIKCCKLANETSQKRFKREYKFLKMIDHPNLVNAYDYFEIGDEQYMIQEFVEGLTLCYIIKNKNKMFSLPEQLAIAHKMAVGVEVLNAAGIIHRDIKPDNIMVNIHSGDVTIVDLGVGKDFSGESTALTIQDTVIGTIPYISPEQARSEISKQSDISGFRTQGFTGHCYPRIYRPT